MGRGWCSKFKMISDVMYSNVWPVPVYDGGGVYLHASVLSSSI